MMHASDVRLAAREDFRVAFHGLKVLRCREDSSCLAYAISRKPMDLLNAVTMSFPFLVAHMMCSEMTAVNTVDKYSSHYQAWNPHNQVLIHLLELLLQQTSLHH